MECIWEGFRFYEKARAMGSLIGAMHCRFFSVNTRGCVYARATVIAYQSTSSLLPCTGLLSVPGILWTGGDKRRQVFLSNLLRQRSYGSACVVAQLHAIRSQAQLTLFLQRPAPPWVVAPLPIARSIFLKTRASVLSALSLPSKSRLLMLGPAGR